jgi:hypothetical protein
LSTNRDYSASEWNSIVTAPAAAGLLVTLADASGPIGVVKEGMAVTRAVTDATATDAPEVVTSIVAEVRAGSIRPELPKLPLTDKEQAKTVLLEAIKAGVTAVEARSPTEVHGYKTWLVATAIRVAQASKEGGFLGFGGTLVSAEEQAALTALAAALGVPVPDPQAT